MNENKPGVEKSPEFRKALDTIQYYNKYCKIKDRDLEDAVSELMNLMRKVFITSQRPPYLMHVAEKSKGSEARDRGDCYIKFDKVLSSDEKVKFEGLISKLKRDDKYNKLKPEDFLSVVMDQFTEATGAYCNFANEPSDKELRW